MQLTWTLGVGVVATILGAMIALTGATTPSWVAVIVPAIVTLVHAVETGE